MIRVGLSRRFPGQGAAIRGARFNPKGMPALYLALTIMTAVKEINQGFAHKIEPCVLCSYDIDCEDVVDLRNEEGRKAAASHSLNGLRLVLRISQGREPPSWRIARNLSTPERLASLFRASRPGRRRRIKISCFGNGARASHTKFQFTILADGCLRISSLGNSGGGERLTSR